MQEDILRRDFTINSFLMNEKGYIFDYMQGYKDLQKKQIKTIGNPYKKLSEDALRILRIFYFQSKLNFKIEKKTEKALKKNIFLLQKIKPEQIFKEFQKILKQPYFMKAFLSLKNTNAISFLNIGLQKSILFIIKNNWPTINEELFFGLTFILDCRIIDYFKFNKKRYLNKYLYFKKKIKHYL
ncbi:hypothetical protein [Candidatus Phytoplasma palmae]|uniref:hypothetical protein n=1 Tax=Candidatus Phytoplasma palmae TaxID=85624 RepID=UPI003990DA92